MSKEDLTEDQLAQITRLVDTHGERRAAELLSIGVDSMLRVLARRTNVRQGTVALIQRNLERLAQETK